MAQCLRIYLKLSCITFKLNGEENMYILHFQEMMGM